jgi:hypothetical protein
MTGSRTAIPRLLAACDTGFRSIPANSELNQASYYHACQGGQLRAAQRLLAAGADPRDIPDYAGDATPLDMALGPHTRREQLATWLREHGAGATAGDGE